MSFRLFVWWCALCGGWAALLGWAVGRWVGGDDPLGSAGLKGLCLGLPIALALGLVDAVWIFSLRQFRRVLPRVLTCVGVGTVGVVGQLLFGWRGWAFCLVLGWGLTGLMVGVSLAAYDFLYAWVRQQDLRDERRKVLRVVAGGGGGGLVGGLLYLILRGVLGGVFPDKPDLWSPSATGFVALGLCIGLWIGVARVALQEAWLKVEAGFRSGRELLLDKPELTLGRGEGCDLGLFGDPAIDRLHARIARQGDGYVLLDAGSAGDLIGVGAARVRFLERGKQSGTG
jgi:hypothetical protein